MGRGMQMISGGVDDQRNQTISGINDQRNQTISWLGCTALNVRCTSRLLKWGGFLFGW